MARALDLGKDQKFPYRFLFLSQVSEQLTRYTQSIGVDEREALKALGLAIANQIGEVSDLGSAALLLNSSCLVLLYRQDQGTAQKLSGQAHNLNRSCGSLLYVSSSRATDLCRSLVLRLIERLGLEEIRRADFTAIPHGGFIVLDHISPLLALKPEQLNASGDPDRLLVIVDDCAISGLRFKQFLKSCASRRIVFAHLYSPPALRAAIEAQEPRILACVSTEDLREVSQRVPPEHEQRRRERIERGECYWIGSTEALCFPWNEPDRSFWNPVTSRQERAWKIVPPEFCSKNHPAPETTPIPIQIQPEGRGPLRPSRRAIFGELDGALVLCDMETGRCFGLEGVAADLWRALLVHGHPEAVASALQAEYDVPGEVFREDTRNFFKDLEARGLLEWTEPD
jgi:hypothetical protein